MSKKKEAKRPQTVEEALQVVQEVLKAEREGFQGELVLAKRARTRVEKDSHETCAMLRDVERTARDRLWKIHGLHRLVFWMTLGLLAAGSTAVGLLLERWAG